MFIDGINKYDQQHLFEELFHKTGPFEYYSFWVETNQCEECLRFDEDLLPVNILSKAMAINFIKFLKHKNNIPNHLVITQENWYDEEDPDNDEPSEKPFIRGDEFMES